MPCSISQGLEASAVPCVHWMGVTDRGLLVSANSKQHRPTVGDIGQGLHALNVACAHLVNDVCQRHATSAKACMHQSCQARIDCATSSVACAHRPTIGNIAQGLHTSTVACAHRLGDNGRGLRASARRRPPTAGGISQGLHASDIASAHLANDVEQRHATSAKACTLQPWCVRIGWASPAVACAHRPTTGDIGQGLDTSIVVCAHLANHVGQRHAASAKACMN